MVQPKVPVQELNEEFLYNLKDRLIFEIEIRYMVYDGCCKEEEDQWFQLMYLIPYWNIVQKVKEFTPYFEELNVRFPFEEVYRQPIELYTVFPSSMINVKEEEFIFRGEKIIVKYEYII